MQHIIAAGGHRDRKAYHGGDRSDFRLLFPLIVDCFSTDLPLFFPLFFDSARAGTAGPDVLPPKNDEFCITNDGICITNDGFCN